MNLLFFGDEFFYETPWDLKTGGNLTPQTRHPKDS